MIYPMVEYAKSINKNTADLTSSDMVNFTKWWMKQPQREDIIMAIKAQQKRATQVGKYLQTIKQEDNIMENEQTENEVVCTMELTKADVDALLFALSRVFEDYEMSEHEYGASLLGLKEGLEGV